MKPEGWKTQVLGDLCELVNGNGFKATDWATTGLPIIRIQNLNGSTNFNYFNGAVQDRWIVEPGDLLFAWAGVRGVSFGPCLWDGPRGVLNQHIFRVVPKAGVSKPFLHGLMKHVTPRIEGNSHGFKSNFVHVQRGNVLNQIVHTPPLAEQQKIAAVLTTWDRAIELTEKLIAAKQQRKRALMQQLLTGRVRLPGFSSRWDIAKTGELFKPVSVKNHPDERVLSVTQDMGVVYRDQMDRKIGMSLDNTGGYKLVRPGDFIISLRSFQGGLEMSRVRGIVSPAYHVIHPVVEIDRDFFRHYFKSAEFIARLAVAVIGIRDGKQISFEDFGFMKCRLPPFEEQSAIAAVLNAADREIELHQQKLDALRRQKKGLMQQLLTGKVRVRVEKEEQLT